MSSYQPRTHRGRFSVLLGQQAAQQSKNVVQFPFQIDDILTQTSLLVLRSGQILTELCLIPSGTSEGNQRSSV